MIRVVKMKFSPNKVSIFKLIFSQNRSKILNFEGLESLQLLQDKTDKNIFFTYSTWKSEKDLESYRTSVVFSDIWKQVKPLFSEKAQAWSLEKILG